MRSRIDYIACDPPRRRGCHLDGLVRLPPGVGVSVEQAEAGCLVMEGGAAPIEETCALCHNHISGRVATQKANRRAWIELTAAWVKYRQQRSPSRTIGSVDCDQLLERGKRQENAALSGLSIGGQQEPA